MAAPAQDDRRTPAIVLAGGRSRRMGRPKAGVAWGGTTLLGRAVATARAAGLRPVVMAKRGPELPRVAAERWEEADEPVHPLCGIAAALRRAGGPVVVLPVDLPGVPPALLAHLAARPEPLLVVEGAGRLHPLLGRFSPEHVGALEAAARAGDPVVRTVLGLRAATLADDELAVFGEPAGMLVNVNRPEDLVGG